MRFRTVLLPVPSDWGTARRALMSPWRLPHLVAVFLRPASKLLQAPSDRCSSFFSLLQPCNPIKRRQDGGFRRLSTNVDRRWLCRERLITWLLAALEDNMAMDAAAWGAGAGEAAGVEREGGSRWHAGLSRSQR